ncbi:hypothetical protein ACSBR1_039769 [Camellia fascicularis]
MMAQVLAAKVITVEPSLQRLRVSVTSSMSPGNTALSHPIWRPKTGSPLGLEWHPQDPLLTTPQEVSPPPFSTLISPMKILLWNCRGIANPHFCRLLRDLVNEYHPLLVIIMETRVEGTRGRSLASNMGFSSVHISEPVGFAGGIWLLWNDSNIQCDILTNSFAGNPCVDIGSLSPFSLLIFCYLC